MEAELIREIISLLKDLNAGVSVYWSSLILTGIIVLIASFLGSYFRGKGQNLATKEDIAEITQKVEGIRADYAKKLESFSHHNQLKMAALDKRLEAHQAAYKLWLQLRRSLHKRDKNTDMVIKCQNWWEKNCLYLDTESREAFISAVHAVAIHPDLTGGQAPKEELLKNWEFINGCGETIIRGSGLPSFGKNELAAIDKISGING